MQEGQFSWTQYFTDTSQILPCIISVFLIAYGSMRSLAFDVSNAEEKDNLDKVQIINSTQAIYLPIGSSISLLCMFFFSSFFQIIIVFITAGVSVVAFNFVLASFWKSCIYCICRRRNFTDIKYRCCCNNSCAEAWSVTFSIIIVLLWLLTGHWLVIDIIGMVLCIAVITYVRLPNLQVSTYLLCGLVVYDVFWVYFSEKIFKSNVMVHVAMNAAKNPINVAVEKVNLPNSASTFLQYLPHHIQLPGKLIFPSFRHKGYYAVLGLGDIVIPGLLTSFALKFDNFKSKQENSCNKSSLTAINYFRCCLIGYVFGLFLATLFAAVLDTPQPALLFLVPSTLVPLWLLAYRKNDIACMWTGSFDESKIKRDNDIV